MTQPLPAGVWRRRSPTADLKKAGRNVPRAGFTVLAAGVATAMMLTAATGTAAQGQGIAHLAGGVSAEERGLISAREAEYNVKLVFTLIEGNYLADVAVAIKNPAGAVVLATQSPGPILLARLPAGEYTVEAAYDGKTQTRKLAAGKGMRTEYLRWPSDPQKDFPGPKSSEREP